MKLPSVYFPTKYSYEGISLGILIFIILLIAADASFAQSSDVKKLSINGQSFSHMPRSTNSRAVCDRIPNRSMDGTCNNTNNDFTSEWGATDIELFRAVASAYGAPDFHNDMGGNCRLSPRAISNLVVDQPTDLPSPRNLSSLVFTWGQFIDHDIDLTPEGHTEYYPVLLPSDEQLFTDNIPFFRSAPADGSGVDAPRQQQNIITSWLDGSQVYGSDDTRAFWLRTFNRGKLKTSEGNLLPYNTLDGSLNAAIDPNAPSMAGDGGGTAKVFVAGDVRANEQPGLTSLHTLFVLEHNRICDDLAQQGMNNDEQIYQRARKMVGGIIQNITYRDFLPALGINIQNYNGYRPNIRPDISNIFATAAYRLGHTMVTDNIPLLAPNCDDVGPGAIELLEGFFNPTVIATYGIEPLIQGLAAQTQQKVDAKIVDNLRNFLFPVPGSPDPFGLDLASLNIQRGRDHGLPNYSAVRDYYLGGSVENFSDITSDPSLQVALEKAYGSVYDMDLWVGLLSEDPMPNASVGPTLDAILSDQFEKLRDADYYYYQNDPMLSNNEKDRIRRTSLDEVIESNTAIQNIQNNVFFADNCGSGGGGGGGGDRPNRPGGNNGGGGLNPITSGLATLDIFPNPSDGNVHIDFLTDIPASNLIITIQDAQGREVYNKKSTTAATIFQYDLNLSELPAGMYILSIQADDQVYSEKFIIDKD